MKNDVKTNYEKNFIFDEIKIYFDDNPIFKFGAYYGEIDKTGKILSAIKCDNLCRVDKENFAICINDKWGIISNNKEWLIEPEYDSLDVTEGCFYIARKNGKYGVININNDVITDFIYDSFEMVSFSKKYYAAGKDGKIGIVNLYGREIAPFIFKEIELYAEDLGTARFNGKYGLIDDEGSPINIDIESLDNQLQKTCCVTMNKQKILDEKIKNFMNKAFYDFDNCNFDSAKENFSKAIELKPDLIEAYEYRALSYSSCNLDNKAIADYSTIIKYNPNYVEAYIDRGRVYSYSEQYDLSINDYTKAIELRPKDYNLYFLRGQIYCKFQQYENAIKDFFKMSKSDYMLEKFHAYMKLGDTYCLIKDFKKAILSYTKAIGIFRNNYTGLPLVDCYKKRSELYLQLGMTEEAEKDLKLMAEAEKELSNSKLQIQT